MTKLKQFVYKKLKHPKNPNKEHWLLTLHQHFVKTFERNFNPSTFNSHVPILIRELLSSQYEQVVECGIGLSTEVLTTLCEFQDIPYVGFDNQKVWVDKLKLNFNVFYVENWKHVILDRIPDGLLFLDCGPLRWRPILADRSNARCIIIHDSDSVPVGSYHKAGYNRMETNNTLVFYRR